MKRLIATMLIVASALLTSSGLASAAIAAEHVQPELSSQSSSALIGSMQTNSRDIHSGVSIGLCSDGSIDIAGLAKETGAYGVSFNYFNGISPVMTARPFQAGEMINNRSDTTAPALPGLPLILVATKAPIGMYDDSVRAKLSQTVLMTVPAHGCHFHEVTF